MINFVGPLNDEFAFMITTQNKLAQTLIEFLKKNDWNTEQEAYPEKDKSDFNRIAGGHMFALEWA